MTARELLQQARLAEAVDEVSAALRQDPTDRQSRTFLFELLLFAGEFDRANKHLELVSHTDQEAKTGGLLYHTALQAERTRRDLFQGALEESPAPVAGEGPTVAAVAATWNGRPIRTIGDADPRIGPHLEVIAGLEYLWLPFEHIESIEMVAPRRLRDLYWAPARVTTGPAFQGQSLGDVLLPALTPLSFEHPDDTVKLGRETVWARDEAGVEAPYGAKLLVVDDEEIPLLDLRELRSIAAA